MKYCKYILKFKGDPEIVAFLEKHVPRQYEGRGALANARANGRAAKRLFGVMYETTPVVMARAAEQVKAL